MNHAGGATSAARSAISSAESEVRRIKVEVTMKNAAVDVLHAVLVSAVTVLV